MSFHVDPSRMGDLERAEQSQGYVDLTGGTFVIGRKYDDDRRFYFVQGVIPPAGDHPRQWLFVPRETGAKTLLLTDEEIVRMEAAGRFRHASIDPGTGLMKGRVAAPVLLDPALAKGPLRKVYWLRKYIVAHHGFIKSQDRFDAFMAEELKSPDAPPPVSFSTVRREYEKNEETYWGNPLALAVPQEASGGRPRDLTWGPRVAELLQDAMWEVFQLPKWIAQDVLDRLEFLAGEEGIPKETLPSLRTVQDRVAEVPEVVRDILGVGQDKATETHGHTEVRILPDRPLEVVEADEVTLDMEVLDDVTLINLGRPVLLMIRDRMSGIVLAAVLGFTPSFALFTRAVRMAIYPKDMSDYPGLNYPYGGPFAAIALDAASHYRGHGLEQMRLSAGFDVIELTPGAPRAKGAIESLNRHLNERIPHNLPGAVMGNPQEREDFEDTRIMPLIKVSELKFLIYDWICNERNVKPVEGLGFFRRMKAVPAVLWKQNIHKAKKRRPIDVDMFESQVGETAWATIQSAGLRIKYLTYWSDNLHWLVNHKDHKPGKGKHGGTEYQCIRDPNDVGRITVVNPYRGKDCGPELIECRVIAADRAYADGLPLEVHERFVRAYNAQLKENAGAAETPQRQKAKALEVALQARQMRKRLGLGELFGRWMRDQAKRRIASEIRPAPEGAEASADMLDIRSLPDVPPARTRSPHALPALLGPHGPTRLADVEKRSASARKGGAAVADAKPSKVGSPLSRLTIAHEDELDELTQLRNQEDKP